MSILMDPYILCRMLIFISREAGSQTDDELLYKRKHFPGKIMGGKEWSRQAMVQVKKKDRASLNFLHTVFLTSHTSYILLCMIAQNKNNVTVFMNQLKKFVSYVYRRTISGPSQKEFSINQALCFVPVLPLSPILRRCRCMSLPL